MKPIPYARQYISESDKQAVLETLGDSFLTTGPRIAEFEEAFAQYVGAPYAVAVSSGTAALHLCAKALGIKPGMRALTSSLTFAASANCILHEGGEVDFVDVDPATGLMDLDLLEEKLSQVPAGYYEVIIPIDFAGLPLEMHRFRQIADKYQCKIIEDSCHAPGASYTNTKGELEKTGNAQYADLSIFSFHPTKHITTGEGGMITTGDNRLYERLKRLRNHGIYKGPDLMEKGGWYYELRDLGLNYRMTDLQARLGLSQLTHADEWLDRRREIAKTYRLAFQESTIQALADHEGHAYHLFVIKVPRRKDLYEYMRSKQIYCQVHYVPLHLHPLYQEKGWKIGDLPYTEAYYDACLSLPMYPTLSDQEQQYVIDQVLGFYG